MIMKSLTFSQQTLINKQHIFFTLKVYAVMILISLTSLVSGTVEAASCQNYLQGELDWVSSDPKRIVRLIMVSNAAESIQVPDKLPRMSYFMAELKQGSWIFSQSLSGSNKAKMNDIYWVHASYPLVTSSDKWSVSLTPGSSSLLLIKNGKSFSIPLECEGKLLSGHYVNYIQWGTYSFPSKNTKYVLSLSRHTNF